MINCDKENSKGNEEKPKKNIQDQSQDIPWGYLRCAQIDLRSKTKETKNKENIEIPYHY